MASTRAGESSQIRHFSIVVRERVPEANATISCDPLAIVADAASQTTVTAVKHPKISDVVA